MPDRPTYEELERKIHELEVIAVSQKQAGEHRAIGESSYKTLFEAANDAIFIMEDYKFVECNTMTMEIYGCEKQNDILGFYPWDFSPPNQPDGSASKEKAIEMMDNALKGYPQRFYWKHTRKDGVEFDAEVSLNCLETKGKNGLQAIVRDISERKQAEDALHKSEERYRSLVENTLDGYYICEIPSGRFIFLNQRICDIAGYTMQEGMELSIWDVIDPNDHKLIEERIQSRMTGRASNFASNLYDAVRKDGSKYKVEVSSSIVTFNNKPAVQGVLRDVTEKERFNLHLQQVQKMEAIGMLAGGIAHNFNNFLMAIQGCASLLLEDKNPSHPDYEYLQGIEKYVKSAVELTRDLLGFARGGKYEVKPTDLNDLIKRQNTVFSRTRKEIQIHEKYGEKLWVVEVDQGQIQQILLNLYINAWQAMPGGGDLYIQTENTTLDEKEVKPFSAIPGKYVQISVTDTGTGIDDEIIEKIFDPFFTTKEEDQGTGLGLSSAYGIIKNHNGFINVYSEEGKGTTFNIYLPASGKSLIEEVRTPDYPETRYGKGTILLIDDEEIIIEVGQKMLEKLGYDVLVARNGKEAVNVYDEHKHGIDLVILDMVMPGLGGGATYNRLKEIDKDVNVLLSSGYSIDKKAQEVLDNGCRGFIQKPFALKDLSIKIKQLL